jgi:hypothetical protein
MLMLDRRMLLRAGTAAAGAAALAPTVCESAPNTDPAHAKSIKRLDADRPPDPTPTNIPAH